MQYKNTILVVHPHGGYGKILLWCLAYFSGSFQKNASLPSWLLRPPYRSISPYSSNQGVINFITHESSEYHRQTTAEYLQSNNEFCFGCTTATFGHDIAQHQSYINDYKRFFKKIIHLTLDPGCHLLVLHNKLKKLNHAEYQKFFDQVIDRCKESFAAHDPVPKWQLREMLSFEHQGYVVDQCQPIMDNKIINVPVRHLLHHFQSTIIGLLQDLDLTVMHDDQFDRIKNEWINYEKFIDVDSLCQHIVSAVLDDQELEWHSDQLDLIDEAHIQYLLRQHRLELRCYGLDTFPTNSVQLKQLLYSV